MNKHRRTWQFFAVLILVAIIHTDSFAITRGWDGMGDGVNWNDGENWDPDGIPQPGDSADIGDNGVLISPTHLFLIQNLEVGFDGVLSLQGQLNATGGDVENNGTILIDNGVALGPAGLGLGAGVIEGGGEVVLGESITGPGGATISGPPSSAVTNVAGHTIRGEGQFAGNWINESLIRAEDADGDLAGTLRFTGQMTNNGVIRSSATGEIAFATDMTSGATGRIIADAGTIHLNNARFIGGSFKSENGGHFESTGNSLRFNGVHLKGNLQMTNPGALIGTLVVEGNGFTNDGTIDLGPDGPGSNITFDSTATISGTGEIVMHHGGLGGRVISTTGNVGTFGAGQTVRGAGQIEGAITNHGTIIAQPVDNAILEFFGNPKTNHNVIRADAGAVVRLAGSTITQDTLTGRIIANGGKVELANAPLGAANVVNGRLETVGSGTIEVTGSARLDNVKNTGVLNVQSSRVLTVGGHVLANDGTITMHATMDTLGAATLQLRNGTTLSGTGELILTPALPNRINRILIATNETASHQQHTIRGEGFINGFGNEGTLINFGTIAGTSAANDIEFLGGELRGPGLLKNVRIGPNTTHAPGVNSVVNRAGTVPLEGNYLISGAGSKLKLDIGGTTAGTEFDQLVSNDPANLITIGPGSTTLEVSLFNNFIPAVNDTFTIISTAGSISGQFVNELLPINVPNAHIEWDVIYHPQSVQLKVLSVSQLLGDYNMNGVVDTADYTVWRNRFGDSEALPNDDTPGVDGGDYTRWKQNFGLVAAGNGAFAKSAATVPEPTMLGLVAGVLLAVAVRLRTFRSHYANGVRPDREQ